MHPSVSVVYVADLYERVGYTRLPVSMMPHSPGYVEKKMRHLTSFNTKHARMCYNLKYQWSNYFAQSFEWGEGWDLTNCPIGGAFELCIIQIPTLNTFPQHCPGGNSGA